MTKAHPSIIVPGGEAPGDNFYLLDRTLEDLAVSSGLPIAAFLPARVAQRVTTVRDAREAADLAYRLGGRDAKPTREVVLIGPDGRTPIVLPGFGVTEASEMQELAEEVYEVQSKRLRERGAVVDFDRLRAEAGLPSSAEAPEKIREAIHERMRRHQRNPVTDPARQPNKPRGYVAGVDPTEQGDTAA